MAYQVPTRWSEGDKPTAANMNKYSDSLNAIHTLTGDAALNFPVLWDRENFSATFQDSNFFMAHKQRYLHYKSSGELVSLDGANTTSLPNPSGSTYLSYDLDTVDWLSYGDIYQITGCTFCAEDETP